MSAIRRKHDPAFKAKVALSASSGDATLVALGTGRRRLYFTGCDAHGRPRGHVVFGGDHYHHGAEIFIETVLRRSPPGTWKMTDAGVQLMGPGLLPEAAPPTTAEIRRDLRRLIDRQHIR